MQSVIKLPSKSVARSARQLQTPDARATNELRQPIATGKAIFQPGEGRRLYRIESGAVCHFSQSADGRFEVIEFAFPSVIIGLGYLPTHTSTAVAMVDTSVNIVTAKELEQLLLSDDRLALRLADAGEREFDSLRAKSLNPSLLPALQRLAHYLLAIASINGAEGRDGMLIADDVSSGYVARQLHMTIDTLAMALLSLRRGGMVEVSYQGLRIVDLTGLEALAATA